MRWLWRRRVKLLLLLIPVYALAVTFGGCADRLVLHPSTHPIDAGAATQHLITDPYGRKIEIWTARSPAVGGWSGPRAYVLEFCGNATRAEQIAQYVAGRWKNYPIEAWVVNYPGYGQSEGGAHFFLIPSAALTTFDAMAKLADGKPIFIEGASLGSVPALYVATQRDIAGLVIHNPPPLQKLILGRYGWWNLWLVAGPVAMQIPQELNSLKNAPKVHVPAVFITADKDSLVPPSYQQSIIDIYAGPKRVIVMKDASHWDSVTGLAETQLQSGLDWLWTSSR